MSNGYLWWTVFAWRSKSQLGAKLGPVAIEFWGGVAGLTGGGFSVSLLDRWSFTRWGRGQ